ncbi:MAG: ferredoxin-type protein NapF [Bacteroidota bacterium]
MDLSRRSFLGARTSPGAVFRPPWSLAESAFTERCSRCGACAANCETGLLKIGRGGFPEADFAVASCTFCGNCARDCRTGAIQKDTDARAWKDFVISIRPACLSTQNVFCRTCGEVCDSGAIRFSLRPGGAARPQIDAERCTGCGACIAPCPTAAIVRLPIPTESNLS